MNSKSQRLNKLHHLKKNLLPFAIIFLITISLQYWYQYAATGTLYLFTYIKEGFNWFDPAWYGILFSPRRGLFFWAPALLLLIPSITSIRKPSSWFLGSILIISIQSYLIASWHQWWYGDSYGQRVFIDIYPFFALHLAQSLTIISKHRSAVIITSLLLTLCVLVNCILSYQWWTGKLYRDHTFTYDVLNALQIWRK